MEGFGKGGSGKVTVWTVQELFIMNRELKIKPIYECRCDERLQTKTKRFTRLSYSFLHARAPFLISFFESCRMSFRLS